VGGANQGAVGEQGKTTEPTLASRPAAPLRLSDDAILVLVDFQKGFDQFPNRNNPGLEGNVKSLLEAWRMSGRPLVHVRHDSVEPKSVFRPGLPGNAFRAEATPLAGEPIVPKSTHSALIGPGLGKLLGEGGHKTVVLCGIQTNYCVASTARMAGNLGYQTYVVGDACATFDQPLLTGAKVPAQLAHDLALAELHGEFATVVSTSEVLAALSARSPEAATGRLGRAAAPKYQKTAGRVP
jgi:nicotinamidase-related amidase